MADIKPGDLVDLDDTAAATDASVVDLDIDEHGGDLPPQAKRQADGTILVTLKQSVTIRFRKAGVEREETTTTLLMSALTGKDMRDVTQAGGAAAIAAAARSAGWQGAKFDALFDRMAADDATAVLEVAAHFISGGRRIGR